MKAHIVDDRLFGRYGKKAFKILQIWNKFDIFNNTRIYNM